MGDLRCPLPAQLPFRPPAAAGHGIDALQPARVRRRFLQSAGTLEGLAGKLGIDPSGLATTVARFNGFAASGRDAEFQRGESSYDLLYGDVRIGPNPCLAPILEAPFHGVEIFPGDLGTKGGILTDRHAMALDREGRPIPGLYAIGNSAASQMGRYYPGAGATLGPGMTFGYVAARHALGVGAGEGAAA
ncbi:MAG: FAD-binding protein [Gammaproteobacteria bacterium]